jgi:hypothetical protein
MLARCHDLVSRILRSLLFAAMFAAGVLPAQGQIYELPHPDTTAGNAFGGAVAIDGDRALVGAVGEASCGENAGAAYIFERDPTTDAWAEVARLVPRDCTPKTFFGRSVALSGDRALVAASGEFFSEETSNAAYVFERDPADSTWKQVARLTAPRQMREGAFAASVALDGDRALVTTWGDPSDGQYGGAAYVFEWDPATETWEEAARLTGSGGVKAGIFGGASALDGDRAAVAASTYFDRRPGSVYLFERDPATGTWQETTRLGSIDDFYISVSLSGDWLLVGESKGGRGKSGVATLFAREAPGTWRHRVTLQPNPPYDDGAFGSAVALDGDRALVAGYDEQLGFSFNIDRVVYVFAHNPETNAWRQRSIMDIGEVDFGVAIDVDGDLAIIGQASDARPGAAYVVRLR